MTELLFSFACVTAVKGALLLLCALAATLFLKRAAARHRVLSLAMLGLLALPFASVLLPYPLATSLLSLPPSCDLQRG